MIKYEKPTENIGVNYKGKEVFIRSRLKGFRSFKNLPFLFPLKGRMIKRVR